MSDRILDIAEAPALLRAENGLLVIKRDNQDAVSLPLAEFAAVVLSHPQITCSRAALTGLVTAGAVVVTCDDHHLPVGMLLPLTGYHAPARRLRAQADAPLPLRKQLWKQLVVAKIRAQAQLLKDHRGDDFGLRGLATEVRSGDESNVEGQAARVYWLALFDSLEFQRSRESQDQNRFLNYGYAVLRAIVARAICAAGLHPGLGLHHHHRNNAFCLADDLMEPFRPIVDEAVLKVMDQFGVDAPMDRRVKEVLIGALQTRIPLDGEDRTLTDVAGKLAASLALAFEGGERKLALPDA